MTPGQKARIAEYQKAYRAANPEKIAERARAYRAANPEKTAESARKYYAANAGKNSVKDAARSRKYYAANHKKALDRRAAYRNKNKNLISEKKKLLYRENEEKFKTKDKAWRDAMPDGFVAKALGMPLSAVPPELIELKRALLLGHRIQRSLKKEIGNEPHRPNER